MATTNGDVAPPSQAHPDLERGRRALGSGRWSEAAEALTAAVERGGLDRKARAEAFEGVGVASYWLEDGQRAVAAHERAFSLYREGGDRASAARMALWLSDDHMVLFGSLAICSGWLQRAERLSDDIPGTPEWAWFPLYRGHYVLQVDHDIEGAIDLAASGRERARQVGASEVEVVALALEGLARVLRGEVAAGMRCLDEACATAVTHGLDNLMAVGWALCYQIQGCDEIRDFPRAAEWCQRVMEFCERWDLRPLFSSCRIRYASILTWQGNWADAEAQVDDMLGRDGSSGEGRSAAASARTGMIRLAEIRRRQGRLDEAESLLERAGEHRWATLARAWIGLDRGHLDVAFDLAGRVLRGLPADARAERADALLIQAIASARDGDPARAGPVLEELSETAAKVATEPLLAAAAHARGVHAAASREPAEALRALEEALGHYDRGGAPHEAGIVRLELAQVLADLGRTAIARREVERARDTFEALGAAGDLARADACLARFDGRPIGAGSTAASPLTDREIEVLRLVATGLSNPEIAEELFLSPHTVKRHVSNILTKLCASSRAQAVGEAARQGML